MPKHIVLSAPAEHGLKTRKEYPERPTAVNEDAREFVTSLT